jgi:peptide/nickel transport system substrate-binding protein
MKTHKRAQLSSIRNSTPSAAAGALILSLLLAGCSTAPSQDTSGPSQDTSGVELGSLVNSTPAGANQLEFVSWAMVREPFTLDPMMSQTLGESPVVANMCEGLVRLSDELEIEPALASSFEQTSPTTWVFSLRDGVTFWDGSPLLAVDVVASLNRNISDPLSYWTGYLDSIKSVYADDDSTVTIELNKPDNIFLELMTTAAGAVSSANALSIAGSDYGSVSSGVMCTGPFQFSKWNVGENIQLTAFDDYWDGAPLTKNLTLKWLSDESSLTQALLTGEIDGTFVAPYSGITNLENSEAGSLVFGSSSNKLMLMPTEKEGPLHNALVRRAILLATDRQAIATSVLAGAALPGESYLSPFWSAENRDAWDEAYATFESDFDKDQAQELIDESGESNITLVVAIPSNQSYVNLANAMTQMLAEVGINMQVKVLTSAENDALWFDPDLRSNYDGFIAGTFSVIPNPVEQMLYVTKGHVYNYGGYVNPEFEKAFELARHSEDATVALGEAIKAAAILDNDVPWIPILVEPVRLWQKNGVSGAGATSSSVLWSPWARKLGGID